MNKKSITFPIIIPVKKKSVRLPNKNHKLIGYTLDYLQQYGKENIIILTDDEELIEKYNLDYRIIIDTSTQNDLLYAINDCVKKLGCNYAFYLCVTNPFREDDLLYRMEDKCRENAYKVPLITSKTIVPNRKIFLLDDNDKFKYKSKKGRKGKYVKNSFMIDGAAYLINASFLNEICKTNNPNKLFWESDFKTVLNNVPFIDIDTQKDMDNLMFYAKLKEG